MEDEINKAELDRRVEREFEELKLAGRLYRFKPEPRCKVCRQEDTGLMALVNKLLAAGEPYTNVLRDIEVFNDKLSEKDKVTYSSIRTHHKRHFATNNAAAAVYRRILEKNAEEADIDFIGGVKNAVTPLAYLEVMMNKGYREMTSYEGNVDPEMGMKAALKLHDLTQEAPEQDLQELIHKTNRLIEIVRDTVPVTYWEEIVKRIEAEEKKSDPKDDVIDAEFEDDTEDHEDDLEEEN